LRTPNLNYSSLAGLNNLEKLAPHYSSADQLAAFRQQMADAVANAQTKAQVMPIPALRRLLLRAVSVLSASPTVSKFEAALRKGLTDEIYTRLMRTFCTT
jgi:hypothetical protein